MQNIVSFIGLFYKKRPSYVTHCMYGVATISRLLKIKVSFPEYRLFYRALLQKRPMVLRSLLIVATPYQLARRVAFADLYVYGVALASRIDKIIGLFCKKTL